MNINGIEFIPHDNIRMAKLGWNTLAESIISTVMACGRFKKGTFLFFRAAFVLNREGLDEDDECNWLRNAKKQPFFSVPVLVFRKDEGKYLDDRNYELQVYIGNHEREFELTLDVLTEQYAKRKGINLNDDVYSYHSGGFSDGALKLMGTMPSEKPEGMTLFYLNRARFFADNSYMAGQLTALGNPKVRVGCWYDDRYNSENEIMRSFKSRDFFSLNDTDSWKHSAYDIQLTGWMTYHAGCAVYRESFMQNMITDRICHALNPIERRLRYIKCFDMIPSYSDAMYLVPEVETVRKIKDYYPYDYRGKAGKISTSYRWCFRNRNSLPFKNALGYTLFRPVDYELCVRTPGNNVLVMDDYDISPTLWTYFTTLKIDGRTCSTLLSEGYDCIALEKLLGPVKFEELLSERTSESLYIIEDNRLRPEISTKKPVNRNQPAIKVDIFHCEEGTHIRLSHMSQDEKTDGNVFEEVFYRKNEDGSYTRVYDRGIRVPGESRKLLYSYLEDLSMRLELDASEYGKADLLGLFSGKDFTKVEGLTNSYPVYGKNFEQTHKRETNRKKLWKDFIYTPGEKK